MDETGLHFTLDRGQGERYMFNSAELGRLRETLNRASFNRGSLIGPAQMMWREAYAYDGNGNRASKTTPWGTITYQYDRENRLISAGSITYTHDKDGNLLSETGPYREARYEYNGQNRMAASTVTGRT